MNFYDVLAAEKWDGGIPTIKFFDLLFAQSMGGGEQWQTYEGTLPATFNANGDDMRQYRIYGNTGGVGDKTVNLFDESKAGMIRFRHTEAGLRYGINFGILPAGAYTISFNRIGSQKLILTFLYSDNYSEVDLTYNSPYTFTAPEDAEIIIRTQADSPKTFSDMGFTNIMLTEGTTAPASFVPFGYKLDMAIGSNILQSSEIEQGGWQAAAESAPQKIANPRRCRSKNIYPISGKKIFYDFKSLNVNIAFIDSDGLSLGGSGFKSGAGSVDVFANAVKCLFIIANTDTDAGITPTQVIAAGIWASVDATTTPIYIGNEPLDKDEYIDYQAGKIYRMINGTLTPTDPPVPLPALPTCEETTIVDYTGQSQAVPEKVYFEYKGGEQP
jgi:hypothetical protein